MGYGPVQNDTATVILNSMLSLFWNHAGEVVLITLTILAVVVPILWQRRQNRKAMKVETVSAEAFGELGMPGIALTLNGVAVPRAHLCSVRITNTGRLSISQSDFEGQNPLRIWYNLCGDEDHRFGRNRAMILSAYVRERIPKQLNPKISVNDGALSIQPLLLNSGDSMTIRVMLDGCFNRKPLVQARIQGVREIEVPAEFAADPKRIKLYIAMSVALMAAGLVAIIAFQYVPLGVIWFLTGYVLSLYLSGKLSHIRRVKRSLGLVSRTEVEDL